MAEPIPQTSFAASTRQVTRVGLGGEGILRTTGRSPHARKVILEALEQGITYFDSAPAYRESEVYLGSVWKENPSARQRIFRASKSASRDREGAKSDLDGHFIITHSSNRSSETILFSTSLTG